jgi:hypothetical protein
MIPKKITLKKKVAMVMCLGKLHNYCVDERESSISPLTQGDEATSIELEGAVPLQSYFTNTTEGHLTGQQGLPMQLMDAGNHYPRHVLAGLRRHKERQEKWTSMLPRERMNLNVADKQLQRQTID